jgi:hypothetical protein
MRRIPACNIRRERERERERGREGRKFIDNQG